MRLEATRDNQQRTTRDRRRPRRTEHVILRVTLLIGGLLAVGCTPHIRPYTPKKRDYKPESYASAADGREEGSLWSDSSDSLFTQRRSARVGDLITVEIHETANGARDAGTETSPHTERSPGVRSFATAMSALKAAYPSLDPSKLVEAMSKNDFSGKGKTTSSGKLYATLTARIKKVLPNGDLYFEGHKVVMINEEESHLYLSGVVRPSDIQADNRVGSDVIADAQVEYTGRGPVSDKQKPGWFSRLLDWVNPF